MLWPHPIVVAASFILAAFALHLGAVRFMAQHMGRKGVVFQWKRHVLLGTLAIAGWTGGLLLGLGGTWYSLDVVLVTGGHHQVALAMIPLLMFGYWSGQVMDKTKKRRRFLPLAHGACNLALLLMAAAQAVTGAGLVTGMLLP
jgi:hypothetical protein